MFHATADCLSPELNTVVTREMFNERLLVSWLDVETCQKVLLEAAECRL